MILRMKISITSLAFKLTVAWIIAIFCATLVSAQDALQIKSAKKVTRFLHLEFVLKEFAGKGT